MSDIKTLHQHTNLCTTDELDLWSLPPTQFSHTWNEYVEFFPISAPTSTSNIEFVINNIGQHYLDVNSMFMHVQCKIVQEDGTNTFTVDPTTTAKTSLICIPANNFLHTLFKQVDVFANDKMVSNHESYYYRAYYDTITMAGENWQNKTLSAQLFERDPSTESENFSTISTIDNVASLKSRYNRTKDSTVVDLYGPIITDLTYVTKLLINGVDLRFVFRQNSEKVRLLSSDTTHKFKVEIVKAVMYVKKVELIPSVMLSIEKRLRTNDPATYFLRGFESKFRSISSGVQVITMENLCPERIPQKLTFLFVATDAFQGNLTKNPFKFLNLSLRSSTLYIGTKQITDNYNFKEKQYSKSYYMFMNQLKNTNIPFTMKNYKDDYFALSYTLTPDGETSTLYPITSENVRLRLELENTLSEPITCIILSETPRVMTVDAMRNVNVE